MNENFFDSFWISEQKPDGLPDNWLWLESVFDLDSIVFTYEILFPNGKGIEEKEHYICMSISDYDEAFWMDFNNYNNFTIIWRPSDREEEEFEYDEEDY